MTISIRRILLTAGSCLALGAITVGTAVAAPAPAPTASSGSKPVTYLGHRFTVPADWPVVDLAADPTTCVGFNRHVVYLGTPGDGASCPPGAVGRTEALLVEPAAAGTAAGFTADPVDHQLTATAPGLRVTATYDLDERLVRGIIASAGLPTTASTAARSPKSVAGQAPAATPGVAAAPQAAAAPVALPPEVTNFTGRGFDACAAPSSDLMQAWKTSSPYGAIGIYIGGSAMYCQQPNLTPEWMQKQTADGWRFLPIFVGRQASRITGPADGVTEADNAIAKAAALGLSPGSVLYYDMEAYSTPQYTTTVLGFLSAWTNRLHERGYKSGVYSSGASGINDIVKNLGSGYAIPDVLFCANWNGKETTSDPYIPDNVWVNHERVRQYRGDVQETYAGYTLKIDQDFLDVAVSPPPGPGARVRVDFNGDGNEDIAGKLSDGSLLLWTGNGNGTLNTNSGYAMWPGTGFGQVSEMVAADFNGDGRTDVAGKLSDGSLLLWTGNGNGTLNTQSGYAMWPGTGFKDVHDLLAGDFNGDGRIDLVGKAADGTLMLWTGNGNGTLNTSSGYAMWPDTGFKNVHDLVAGDFNGDGWTDVAGKLSDGTLLLWTGNGSGRLNTYSGYAMWPDKGFGQVHELVAGDFNNDGRTDIAGKLSDGTLLLWTGNGNGTLNTQSGYAMWPDNGFWQVSELL
ncbi:glycoside hydrolase domain-containing protein [Kitasatospora sp. NPDC058032]|uniref:glycoside hydrolase domain-containing protein n=1 Tax=Kitasatospora sp. NPDC058032 TaxID=3346307 RepID=UPI0036D85F82